MVAEKEKELSDRLGCMHKRQMEVAFWLSQGCDNIEISERMRLSVVGVRGYVSRIGKLLGATNHIQVMLAVRKLIF